MIEMTRPSLRDIQRAASGGYLQCECGATLQTYEGVTEHWQLGHFDYQSEKQQFGAVERERVLQEQIDEARRWARRLYKENQELKELMLSEKMERDAELSAGFPDYNTDYDPGESWQVDND